MFPQVQRLLTITGYNGRTNDIVFVDKSPKSDETHSILVFFGGDIQDYVENMNSHRDHGRYSEYNLEAVAQLLSSKYDSSSILVVRPSVLELKTFSCYQNFVPCNNFGTPSFTANHNSLNHLAALISAVFGPQLNFSETSLVTIIGFSKGCVVLNQFLNEFKFHLVSGTEESGAVRAFMKAIHEMIWLDGGHSGGKDTWITSHSLLSSLSQLRISVKVYVTPYQIKDERRPWIGQEEKLFSCTLKKLGVTLQRTVYFEEEPPSLENHFSILKVFQK